MVIYVFADVIRVSIRLYIILFIACWIMDTLLFGLSGSLAFALLLRTKQKQICITSSNTVPQSLMHICRYCNIAIWYIIMLKLWVTFKTNICSFLFLLIYILLMNYVIFRQLFLIMWCPPWLSNTNVCVTIHASSN